MFRIAICDDNINHSFKLEEYVLELFKSNSIKVEVDVYEKPVSLLKRFAEGKTYNIVFLDIEMPDLDGISLAKKIREFDKESYIIYVSNHDKYTLDSFETSPYRYLLKPISSKVIQNLIEDVIEETFENKNIVSFKSSNSFKQYKSDDIILVTSQKGRMVNVVSKQDETVFYEQIKRVYKKLNPNSFVQINQSTIINFNYIRSISPSKVVLANSSEHSISRLQKENVQEKYALFLKKKVLR